MSNKLYSKVFMWMFIGLMISAITAHIISSNEALLNAIYDGPWFMGLIILEIVLVIFLSLKITKISPRSAKISFLVYSLINGMTLSYIFVFYQLTSIALIFGLTSLIFGIFSLIGFTTKLDLSKLGTIAFMGLIGIIIASLINLFLKSPGLDYILSIIGILVFVTLIAYDIQKIRRISALIPNEDNAAIYGALELYLDFINIFIRLLHLFGKAKE